MALSSQSPKAQWSARLALLLPLVALLGGCSPAKKDAAGNDPNASAAQITSKGPSFARDVQPIFDANCVACHQAAGASGGLNLEQGAAYRALVSRKSGESPLVYVAPGDAQASYLLRKLEGTHVEAGGSGERMPLTGPLDPKFIGVIRDWVGAGAKEN